MSRARRYKRSTSAADMLDGRRHVWRVRCNVQETRFDQTARCICGARCACGSGRHDDIATIAGGGHRLYCFDCGTEFDRPGLYRVLGRDADEYIISAMDGEIYCPCPARRGCWHQEAVAAAVLVDCPAPAPKPAAPEITADDVFAMLGRGQ